MPDLRAALADLRARGVRIEEYEAPAPVTVNGIADIGAFLGGVVHRPEPERAGVVQPKV